ncbi:MAG: filamentous hemagglutinin N-terminal domain-containing protein [Thioploca sp.]|nr:filamentous hemagglutinin N-terminal domain-containing protein [Thioploca sp.]
MKFQSLFIMILLINSLNLKAEITLDGTLGHSGVLQGPDYSIEADLGQQVGSNLFHSFHDFNLNKPESATFLGPNSITNIISRVTGGNPSNIDGLIHSTIPNADMYFLNPYGIMFGPNARLEVQGSFHASTAHYVRLGEEGRFDARQPSESLLTAAPVEAFGFLNSKVAPLSVEGLGEIAETNDKIGLRVLDRKTLSLIGGEIEIGMGTFFKTVTIDDKGNESNEINNLPSISAPYGRINLAAVASQGEVKLGGDFIDMSSFSQLADISIKEKSLLQTTGEGGGSIFIRGGQFVVDDSALKAKTRGSQDGGKISLRADKVSLLKGAIINSFTEGIGKGSDINVWATDSIIITGENAEHTQESSIVSGLASLIGSPEQTDENLGDAGDIYLKAKNIVIKDGGGITTSTDTSSRGGSLTIKADETFSVSGDGKRWEKKRNSWDGSYIASSTYSKKENAGDAGEISIDAKNISFLDGSYIYSVKAKVKVE